MYPSSTIRSLGRPWRPAVLLALLLVSPAQAAYRYSYVCPAYAGGIFIGDGAIGVQLFSENVAVGELAGRRHLALDRFRYDECDTSGFFCIALEGGKESLIKVPIASPKLITVGLQYTFSGMTFEAISVQRERYSGRQAVQVMVHSTAADTAGWYSLTLVEGVGVVDFHFPMVRVTNSATGESIELGPLTCHLDSSKGIFPSVAIRKHRKTSS